MKIANQQHVTITKHQYETLLAAQMVVENQREILAGRIQSYTDVEKLLHDLDEPDPVPWCGVSGRDSLRGESAPPTQSSRLLASSQATKYASLRNHPKNKSV